MYKCVFSERLKLSGDEHRRIASGRVFQARWPATAKARSPSVERSVVGTVKCAEEAERRRRRGSMFSTAQMTSCKYLTLLCAFHVTCVIYSFSFMLVYANSQNDIFRTLLNT